MKKRITVVVKSNDCKNLPEKVCEIAEKSATIEIVFALPKGRATLISQTPQPIKEAADNCLLNGAIPVIKNVPHCFMAGYWRYLEDGRGKKTKTEKCKKCCKSDKCPGILEGYVKKFGDSEIVPVSGMLVVTDNERCMILILRKANRATTKKLLELKASKEFSDICAHCVGSDDVMLTGEKLLEKGIIKRELGKNGYVWWLA
ncbi:MAG: hypothetical protein V1493_05950 [Candidatus Diapherotrites archaeon]